MNATISDTRLQRIERKWRRLVFESRFTRVFFAVGASAFCVGLVVPEPFSALLLQNVFPIWFGCSVLAAMSAYAVAFVVSVLKRELFAAVVMALVLYGFGWLACSVLRFGFSGVFAWR